MIEYTEIQDKPFAAYLLEPIRSKAARWPAEGIYNPSTQQWEYSSDTLIAKDCGGGGTTTYSDCRSSGCPASGGVQWDCATDCADYD